MSLHKTVGLLLFLILPGCTVGSVPPPPGLANDSTSQAPPPPPDIRDDPACKLFRWPLALTDAVNLLKQTETFANTGIYIGGEPPPQLAAFNVLLDDPDSVRWFEEIAKTGTHAGKLYALCAFQLIDSKRASTLADELRSADGEVFTQDGCTGGDDDIPNIVHAIGKYSYGKHFREARKRTYEYYDRPNNICERPKRNEDNAG
jgi:hypothetical protein